MRTPPADEATRGSSTVRYHDRDFWSGENLKFTEPHYRLRKSARLIAKVSRGRPRTLLDVGCGVGTLMTLLPENIQYTGVDIAIHSSSTHLIELDFVENPLRLGARRFDIVVAQGVFEYMGSVYDEKLEEIADLLPNEGKLIASYTNFHHRRAHVYPIYNNVQPLGVFRETVERVFEIEKALPASYNWNHSQPRRKAVQSLNRAMTWEIPVAGRKLAVDYFFVCSKRVSGRGGT